MLVLKLYADYPNAIKRACKILEKPSVKAYVDKKLTYIKFCPIFSNNFMVFNVVFCSKFYFNLYAFYTNNF